MTPEQIIDELTYRNYRHNRGLRPDIEPADWVRVYPTAQAMERRYRAERYAHHICDDCGGVIGSWLEYQAADPDTYGCECV